MSFKSKKVRKLFFFMFLVSWKMVEESHPIKDGYRSGPAFLCGRNPTPIYILFFAWTVILIKSLFQPAIKC